MSYRIWKLLVLAGVLAGAGMFARFAVAADDMKAAAPAAAAAGEKTMSPEEKAMMEKMTAFMTPGENHRVLDAFVGNWEFGCKSWMAADAKAEESTGTSEIAWVLDGHFIKETVKGSMMGKPFDGMGLVGYDNLKKEYESIWVDNMSTGVMKSAGMYDASTKTFNCKGTFTCPLVGGDRSSREVVKVVDADHFTRTMYSPGMDGKEFKMMELSYSRKK